MYCFDSSSFIEAWTRSYPEDVFPTFWEKLGAICDGSTVSCSDEVFKELKEKADGCDAWVRSQSGLVIPMDTQQWNTAREVVGAFPLLTKERSRKSRGDPFVIALAKTTGQCVVTEETPSENLRKVVKIPDVCAHYGIRWINLLEFIRERRWIF